MKFFWGGRQIKGKPAVRKNRTTENTPCVKGTGVLSHGGESPEMSYVVLGFGKGKIICS